MDGCIHKLKNHKAICIRAKTIAMTFGYHGTHVHSEFQQELRPSSILLYTKPLMKLCAHLEGSALQWNCSNDVVSPLVKAKADTTALRRNLSELINNKSAVGVLRELAADFAADIATVLDASKEVALLINLTTLFLSVLDGDAKITAVIRDNLICDAAECT